MKRARFQRMADIYGGSIDRWPVVERSEARLGQAADLEARAILDEAAVLDHLLDQSDNANESDAADRVLSALMTRLDRERMVPAADRPTGRAPAIGNPRLGRLRTWSGIGVFALLIISGFVVGETGLFPDNRQTADISVLALPQIYVMASER